MFIFKILELNRNNIDRDNHRHFRYSTKINFTIREFTKR